ncbi:PglL family O-oligosaccharyltransferase [Ramlibacter sp.]|uniref:PglL family O-oligosaccharyltransferase n=1 Tax=Ramlibacter sp. TaxID=1917967 RepID=UPI002D6D8CAA|nr:Wzy polymerase domain-containing protein [Ramlibacter sp.]HYD74574.1 Wzy polymerase domain-containing protein [Ramlibacter sp.]
MEPRRTLEGDAIAAIFGHMGSSISTVLRTKGERGLAETVRRVRPWAGGFLLAAALLYPFASPPSGVVRFDLFATAMLALAAGCWGPGAMRRASVLFLALACAVLFFHRGPYPGPALLATGAGLLAVLALHGASGLQKDDRSLAAFLLALLAGAIANALEGLLQYFGLAWHLHPWVVESLERGIAFGVFRQTNLFAVLLVLASVAAAWALARGLLSQAMAWIACGVLQFAIAASASRIAGLAVLAVAAGAVALLRGASHARARRLLTLQPVLYVSAAVIVPWLAALHGFEPRSIQERFAGLGSDSRLVLWGNAIDMALLRPWTGWGWGEFGFAHYEALLPLRFGGGEQLLDHAHNLVLHVAVELGLPAAVAVAVGLVWLGLRAWRRARREPAAAYPALMLGVLVMHSMVELPLWTPTHLFLAALAAGWFVAVPSAPQGTARGLSAMAILLACGAVLASRQYAAVAAIYDPQERRSREAQQAVIAAAEGSFLFRGQVDFARMAGMVPDDRNAPEVFALARQLLHFSAEPVVITRLVESAWLLGRHEEAQHHAQRLSRAFPRRYEAWLAQLRAQRPPLAAWLAAQGRPATVPDGQP